jgi:hypothetical protein
LLNDEHGGYVISGLLYLKDEIILA